MAVLAAALLLFCACGGGSNASPAPTRSTLVGGTSFTPIPDTGTPAATPVGSPADLVYTVQDGDTLGAIAGRFGVSIDEIVEANNITDIASLAVGDQLTIPGVVATTGPSRTPPPTTVSGDSPIGIHFAMPLAGACLTPNDEQMPNASREYRHGIHEGLDFFTDYACIPVSINTPALAVAEGVIIRADKDYRALTQAQIDALEAESAAQGFTSVGTLDKFRGRQVWIEHGDGIITRYCHLNGIPKDIQVGTRVQQGDTIGLIGDTGTPESASNPEFEIHLHFEVRVGDSYLGAGQDPLETRNTYERLFGFPLSTATPPPSP